MALADRTWPELGATPVILLPLGSTEQHGPHLPLDTDTVIATAVATAAARQLGPSVTVAPSVPYGASGEHQDFPGTISLGAEALRVVLIELVRSLSTWAGRIIVVNGHGGNLDAIVGALRQLRHEDHDVGWVPGQPPGGDGHAGHSETSLMLHLRPEGVRAGLAEPGAVGDLRELLPRLRRDGIAAVSANGVLGDPTGASASTGRELYAQLVADTVARIQIGAVDRYAMLGAS